MTPPQSPDDVCQICGHDRFIHDDVLWPDLIQAWGLNDEEAAYTNVQQGTRCERCGANVRSQALARALLAFTAIEGTLEAGGQAGSALDRRILEINEAGALTPWLSRLSGHVLARYPEVDIAALPYQTVASTSSSIQTHSSMSRIRIGLLSSAGACWRQGARACSPCR